MKKNNFQFEENQFRTEDINPILLKIARINKSLKGNKKGTNQINLICPIKYSRWESNPHSRKNWILNPARLPIPPLEHFKSTKIYLFYLNTLKIAVIMLYRPKKILNLHLIKNNAVLNAAKQYFNDARH